MTNFQTVDVQFESGDQPRYTYKTTECAVPGDMAIIKTKSGYYKIVHIMEVHPEPKLKPNIEYTWLVQIIDTTNYNSLILADAKNNANSR